MQLWRELGVNSWPTFSVVGPDGRLIAQLSGEGRRKVLLSCYRIIHACIFVFKRGIVQWTTKEFLFLKDLDDIVEAALQYYGGKKILDSTPLPLSLEKDNDPRLFTSPLKFPGKLAIDVLNNRLFISDSNHNRIVLSLSLYLMCSFSRFLSGWWINYSSLIVWISGGNWSWWEFYPPNWKHRGGRFTWWYLWWCHLQSASSKELQYILISLAGKWVTNVSSPCISLLVQKSPYILALTSWVNNVTRNCPLAYHLGLLMLASMNIVFWFFFSWLLIIEFDVWFWPLS